MASPVFTTSPWEVVNDAKFLYTEINPLLCLKTITLPEEGVQSANTIVPLRIAFIGVFFVAATSTAKCLFFELNAV